MNNTFNHQLFQQLVDYYLSEEIAAGLPDGYDVRIIQTLKEKHQIDRRPHTIQTRASKVLKGKVSLYPLPRFTGHPTIRFGKDANYAGIWSIVDIILPDVHNRSYVGLAANQFDFVSQYMNGGFMVVCERDRNTYEYLYQLMNGLKNKQNKENSFCLIRNNTHIHIVRFDIFDFFKYIDEVLGERGARFNIFDLDLMCKLPEKDILIDWAKSIYQVAARGPLIIHITAMIGRNITEAEHNNRSEILYQALGDVGFHSIKTSKWKYRDNKIPMRSLRFVLTKE